jgi:Raf kinase inhibitor-like YbhB/YbcL family protein
MRTVLVILGLAAGVIGTGCGNAMKRSGTSPAARASIHVTSDFRAGAFIARVHTCDGADRSPPLRAVGLPAGTEEVVILMRDPDAPGGDFIHWALAGIHVPRGTRSLVLPAARAPAGAVAGRNSFGSLGYRGPCPPAGSAPHHYEITLYALGQPSMLKTGFAADAITGLPALASGTLTGLYARR